MLSELSRREKAANIKPDPNIDVFMKVTKNKKFLSVFISQNKKGGYYFDGCFIYASDWFLITGSSS